MSAFEAYQAYLALKNHFSKPSYDYHRYQGKTGVKVATFEKRKDKLFFQKLAKHPDVFNFLIANLSQNAKLWIRDLAYGEQAEQTYKAWAKRNQALSYNFKSELNALDPNFDKNFVCREGEHPILMRLYLAGEVSLETFCILLRLIGAAKHWDKCMEYDIVWSDLRMKVIKYTPFITFEEDKIKKIVLDKFSEE